MIGRTLAAATVASLAAFGVAQAATATMQDPQGNDVGTVTLTQTPNGVLIDADLSGLPAGDFGFHIHTTGACSPDFDAAGGHFTGGAAAHGYLSEGGPHAGDMPNIHVPDSGALHIEVFNPLVSLDAESLLDSDGSAIMIHGGVDDYESQPTGHAGDRIACGVVTE
jgi:superoxide dismutase, Cu-Zn family